MLRRTVSLGFDHLEDRTVPSAMPVVHPEEIIALNAAYNHGAITQYLEMQPADGEAELFFMGTEEACDPEETMHTGHLNYHISTDGILDLAMIDVPKDLVVKIVPDQGTATRIDEDSVQLSSDVHAITVIIINPADGTELRFEVEVTPGQESSGSIEVKISCGEGEDEEEEAEEAEEGEGGDGGEGGDEGGEEGEDDGEDGGEETELIEGEETAESETSDVLFDGGIDGLLDGDLDGEIDGARDPLAPAADELVIPEATPPRTIDPFEGGAEDTMLVPREAIDRVFAEADFAGLGILHREDADAMAHALVDAPKPQTKNEEAINAFNAATLAVIFSGSVYAAHRLVQHSRKRTIDVLSNKRDR
jgi:hypothetical protein